MDTTGNSLATAANDPGPPPVVPDIRRSTAEGLLPSQRPKSEAQVQHEPIAGTIKAFSVASHNIGGFGLALTKTQAILAYATAANLDMFHIQETKKQPYNALVYIG